MKSNIVQDKSFEFAKKVVILCKKLRREHEFVLSNQLLRSGTSIGANIEESLGSQSSADFFAKISIAYKEARESKFWIKLLISTSYLDGESGKIFLEDVEEICKILCKIRMTCEVKRKKIRN